MKRIIISIIVLLAVLNYVNLENYVYAIENEEYELSLDLMLVGPRPYTVEESESISIPLSSDEENSYVLSFNKIEDGGAKTLIKSEFTSSEIQVKSENEKIIKPKIENGYIVVSGIKEGCAKLTITYNYNGKDYTCVGNWAVYSDDTEYVESRAVLLDNTDIEMQKDETKDINVYFIGLGSYAWSIPEGYTEEEYFTANWESSDESVIQIVGDSNTSKVTIKAISSGEAELSCYANTAELTGTEVVKKIKVNVLNDEGNPTVDDDNDEENDEENEGSDTDEKNDAKKEEDGKETDDTVVKDKYLPQTGEKLLIIFLIAIAILFAIYIHKKDKKV